jgi:acyl dehydratase
MPTEEYNLIYFEDILPGQKVEFGSHAVSREEIIDFASKYDPAAFHLDDEAARESAFGGLISPGLLVASLFVKMWHSLGDDGINEGSPGWDELRWHQPVRPNDVLRCRSEILETRPLRSRPGVGLVRTRQEVLNQTNQVVFSFISNWFCRMRQGNASVD